MIPKTRDLAKGGTQRRELRGRHEHVRLPRALTAARPAPALPARLGARRRRHPRSGTAARPSLRRCRGRLDQQPAQALRRHRRLALRRRGRRRRSRPLPRAAHEPHLRRAHRSVTRLRGREREQSSSGSPSVAGSDAQRAAGPVASSPPARLRRPAAGRLRERAAATRSERDGASPATSSRRLPAARRARDRRSRARSRRGTTRTAARARGARLGDPPVDSDPYAFIRTAAASSSSTQRATTSCASRPAGQDLRARRLPDADACPTAAERTRYSLSRIDAHAAVQSVPTSVIVGPDGALYVGELTGVPFRAGTARVWRVAAGRTTRACSPQASP